MLKRTFLCAIALCLSVTGSTLFAQDHTEVLKKDVGTWDAKLKMWMDGPDGEAMEMTGTETNRMIGENWVVSNFEGDFGGQKFEGSGTVGFDTSKNKYVGTWVDSMSAAITMMEGEYDEKTNSIVFMVDSIDPATGDKVKQKHTVQYKDDNTRVMTMTQPMPGSDKWVKIMEITYTRSKDAAKKATSDK
jgi:hypothetical protein